MRNYFPKRPSGAPLHTLSKLYDVPVGFEPPPPPCFEAEFCLFCGRRRVAVARYRMICLVLVNSHLFPLPCGAGNAVPREGFDLSVIYDSCIIACFSDVGLPSLFVTALSNISCFCQVECTFSNISTC